MFQNFPVVLRQASPPSHFNRIKNDMKSFYFSSFHTQKSSFFQVLPSEEEGSMFLISQSPIYFKMSNCDFVFSFDKQFSLPRNIFISPVLKQGGREDIYSVKIVIPTSYFSSFSFHFPLPPFPLPLPSLISLSLLSKQTREHSAPTSAFLITQPLLNSMNFYFSPYSTETAL